MSFPHGISIWDERMHVWAYFSEDAQTQVSIRLFFSDDGTVDYVYALWKDLDTSELWSDEQGVRSEYA